MWRSSMAVLCTVLLMTAAPAGQLPAVDTLEPSVWIMAPGEDQVVSGSVEITAQASDESGVAGVIFEVDGEAIGPEDLSAPWSAVWNTATSGPGSHILTVIARDGVGNAVRSEVVPVVVGAVNPPPFPPPTNHNPVAVTDWLTSVAGAPVTFTGAALLANDSDPDSHAVALTNVATASTEGGAIVSMGGGTYKYTPAAGFAGVDNFTYTIVDGFGGTATGTVSVNVTPLAPSGLVLALGFDENMGGTALDGSGGNRHGLIQGAERVSGKVGGALRFDGIDDWVTVQDADALDLSSGMTLEAWVNPAVVGGWQTVLLKEGAGTMAYELYANNDLSRPAAYFTTSGGVLRAVTGTAMLAPNTWTHVATTYDGVNMRLYVNGVLVRTAARTGAILATDGVLHIGGNQVWGGEFFSGLIDEVRIYSRALSATEIMSDMSGGATPPPPPANTAPVAGNDSLTTTVGSTVSFTAASLLANDSDADGDTLSVASVAAFGSTGGTIASTGAGSWTYTPPGESESDSFTYVISDGNGGSATGSVSVTVNPVPPPPPPPSGLVLALGFNEGGGSVTSDASGMGHNGLIREAQFVAGRFGNALRFDGINDWVTVADSAALDLSSAMTIEAWVNPSVVGGWQTLLLKEGLGNMAYELYSNNDVSRPAAYFTGANGTLRAATGTAKLAANAWTHLAVSYDGANMRVYVNGVLVRTVARSGAIIATNGSLHIGGNAVWGGEFFSGLIDEVRIYNRALSGEEIQTDMTTAIP